MCKLRVSLMSIEVKNRVLKKKGHPSHKASEAFRCWVLQYYSVLLMLNLKEP